MTPIFGCDRRAQKYCETRCFLGVVLHVLSMEGQESMATTVSCKQHTNTTVFIKKKNTNVTETTATTTGTAIALGWNSPTRHMFFCFSHVCLKRLDMKQQTWYLWATLFADWFYMRDLKKRSPITSKFVHKASHNAWDESCSKVYQLSKLVASEDRTMWIRSRSGKTCRSTLHGVFTDCRVRLKPEETLRHCTMQNVQVCRIYVQYMYMYV